MIKLILIEDKEIFRDGFQAWLSDESIHIVGITDCIKEAIKKISDCMPDILMLDIDIPSANWIEFTRGIRKEYPDLKVLLFSTKKQEDNILNVIRSDAHGYLLRNLNREDFMYAVKKITHGEVYFESEFIKCLLSRYKDATIAQPDSADISITAREMDVLNLIAVGLTNTAMAQKLFTSVRTIETRRKKLLDKTGTTNTATLIKFAVQNGLIK